MKRKLQKVLDGNVFPAELRYKLFSFLADTQSTNNPIDIFVALYSASSHKRFQYLVLNFNSTAFSVLKRTLRSVEDNILHVYATR